MTTPAVDPWPRAVSPTLLRPRGREGREGVAHILGCLALVAGLMLGPAAPLTAADITPHRALYTMTLDETRGDSGVTAANGAMDYEWGETCNGWTIEQRYRLKMHYAESAEVDVTSAFVTWELKDGLRYRFNQRQTRNGELDQEIRGEARLDGPGKGGVAVFTKPRAQTLTLAPAVLFPSAHTILLIDEAKRGTSFLTRQVFDGATDDNAVQVSAVISGKVALNPVSAKLSRLLERPGWHVRLAFFPADAKAEQPDYELGMNLLDNGVSRDIVIDYGDYSIRATLDDIEPLAKPSC